MMVRWLFALTWLAVQAQAQETFVWKGSLRDESGLSIAGATVALQSEKTRVAALTGQGGRFAIAGVPPGTYAVSVRRNDLKATLATRMTIPSSSESHALMLSAAGVLSVTNETGQPSVSGGEKLSSKAVSELPLNKRDFSQLLLLAAGTMTDTNGAANFTQQFAINGQRGTAAEFAMDGADVSDPEMGGATFSNFNVDAVQELRSSSGVMPADIGRGAAGFTDIITRSGTNRLHGSAFEFLRNADLDARNFFDRRSIASPGRIPPFIRNEFGVTMGGPAVVPKLFKGRDKTFFFIQYQGFRQVLGTTQVIPVPSLDDRAGRDTTAFPGDTLLIPVDPRIATFLARYPLPNDPQGPYGNRTYATSSKVTTFSDQFSARVDHRVSGKGQLFARFTWENTAGPITNPSQTAIDPSFAVQFTNQQRNAAITYTVTASPTFTEESSVSFTRTTPSFPAPNHTDPALTFGDGLYEAFNNAAGSVIGSFGNLFQVRQNFTWVRGKHTWKAGGEIRANRDTTVFGLMPNGSYQFGGGAAYSPVDIPSVSGARDIAAGALLPDALSGLLTASAFTYTQAVAPPLFAQGGHIGDSAIHRDAYNIYMEDSWKAADCLVVNFGLRYEIDSPLRESSKRTSDLVLNTPAGVLPGSQLIVNPQPAYAWDKNGWGPRLSLEWRVGRDLTFHAGGAITTLLTNIWQDNSLTGSTPFVVYPRLTAATGQPIPFGATITPQQLPTVYSVTGTPVFAAGNSNAVPPNTIMDVERFEQDLAALSPNHQITPLVVSGIARNFRNGYLATWTAGLEQKIGGATLDAAYVGTAGIELPSMDFPNGYSGADPGFAPYTQFDAAGAVTGGYGPVSLITNRSHSTYHSLQLSMQKNLTTSGLGIQASYTYSKSIDDTSSVIGGFVSGASGAVAQTAPQNPYDTRAEKGPSTFDIKNAFTFSLFQELHAERVTALRAAPRAVVNGWQLLGIGTFLSGAPFTIYSGVQQTGVGSNGTDRPDQIRTPVLSTGRTVREDYFGMGANNASYFSIPIGVAGGTGPNSGMFGALGRDTFRGPAFYDLDLALIKDTPIRRHAGDELASAQFRAEFFNIFNLVNFGLPSNIVLGPGFGEISRTAGSSRQIQFSLKLIY